MIYQLTFGEINDNQISSYDETLWIFESKSKHDAVEKTNQLLNKEQEQVIGYIDFFNIDVNNALFYLVEIDTGSRWAEQDDVIASGEYTNNVFKWENIYEGL